MGSDREPANYRVDPNVKRAFETHVDGIDKTGQGRYGRHLEKAMRQYMQRDRLNQLYDLLYHVADSLGVEKVNEKQMPMMDGLYDVPQGKNPGDVERRQQAVIDALLDMAEDDRLPKDDHGHFATKKTIEDQIRDVANIKSRPTTKDYLKDITRRSMFRLHPERNNTWLVEP